MTPLAEQFDSPVWSIVIAGERLRRTGDFAAAIGKFTEAIGAFDATTPLHVRVETHICRGVALGQSGDHDAALIEFSTTIRLAPDRALAYYNRAFSHEQKRQYDAAIADYDRAIALKPTESDYYLRRGMTFKRLGRQTDARKDFAAVRQLKKGHKTRDTNI